MTHPPFARAQGIADWTAPSNPRRNNGRKGEVKSTTVSNKYDLLDDEKGKEMGAESGKESSARPPPESVGGTGKAPSTTHSVHAPAIPLPASCLPVAHSQA